MVRLLSVDEKLYYPTLIRPIDNKTFDCGSSHGPTVETIEEGRVPRVFDLSLVIPDQSYIVQWIPRPRPLSDRGGARSVKSRSEGGRLLTI